MKIIKEKVLYDMRWRHPEYANISPETAIDLTIKHVLKLIDEMIKHNKGFPVILRELYKLRSMIEGK